MTALAAAALAALAGHHRTAIAQIDDAAADVPVLAVQARLQRDVSSVAVGTGRAEWSATPSDGWSVSPAQWVSGLAAWASGELDPLAALLAVVAGEDARIPAGCAALVGHASASLDPRPVVVHRAGAGGVRVVDEEAAVTWVPLRALLADMRRRRASATGRADPLVGIHPALFGDLHQPAARDEAIAVLPIGDTVTLAGRLVVEAPDAAIGMVGRLASLAPSGFAAAISAREAAAASADLGAPAAGVAMVLHAHDRSVATPVQLDLLADPPRLARGAQVVSTGHWRRPMVRRLAALLAVGSWTREQVVAWLWPDASPASGMRSLRVALHYLRDALDPDRPVGSPSLLVASAADATALVPLTGFSVDLWVVGDALDVAEVHRAAGRHADAADAIRGVAQRWATPSAEIMALEPVARSVDRLGTRLVDAMCDAGDTFAALGNGEAAMEMGNAIVTFEPLRQHGYRLMIASCLAAGRTVAASAVLETCRRVLYEADVGLASETEMLARVLDRTYGRARR
ncbi:MAG: BTAD domain-containing putative transcriptional regulator [Ilumatobacteraceae bacterium]